MYIAEIVFDATPLDERALVHTDQVFEIPHHLNKISLENKLGNIVKEARMPEVLNLLSLSIHRLLHESDERTVDEVQAAAIHAVEGLKGLEKFFLDYGQITLKNQSDKPSGPGAQLFGVSAQPTPTTSSEKGTSRWCRLRRFSLINPVDFIIMAQINTKQPIVVLGE